MTRTRVSCCPLSPGPRSMTLPLALALSACSAAVTADNPFDPAGTGPKAPGLLEGVLVLEGTADASRATVVLYNADGEFAASAVPEASGEFATGEISAGTYRLEVETPVENQPVIRDAVEVLPGKLTDVGVIRCPAAPADGTITGRVLVLGPGLTAANIQVLATRESSGLGETFVRVTDATGGYGFTLLPPGTYRLRADRGGLTPDQTVVDVVPASPSPTGLTAAATAADMKLYPASAVIQMVAQTRDGAVQRPAFVADTQLDLELLSFGGVNEMRVSESPDMRENDTEVPWRNYVAQIPFTLSGGEGVKTLYAEFRVVDGGGVERLRSDRYSTSTILDETAPTIVALSPEVPFVVDGGVTFIGDDTPVAIRARLFDAAAGVAGLRFAVEGEVLEMAAFADFTSVVASIEHVILASLSAGSGAKVIVVEARDRAWNVSAPSSLTLVRDVTPPVFGGAGLELDDGATATRSRVVRLTLDVADVGSGLTELAVANGGIDCDTAAYDPYVSERLWTLPDADGNHDVFVCVRDAVGNVASSASAIRLDRTAPTGSLVIGGGNPAWSDVAGVSVTLTSSEAGTYAMANEAIDCGTAAFDALPAGAITWSLRPENGIRTVVACLKDAAGNMALVRDEITLDLVDPETPSVTINDGDSVTADAVVALSLSALDNFGVTHMYLSRTGAFDGADGVWESFSTTATWDMAPGQHTGTASRSVYVRTRDAAGRTSGTASASISVDYDPPVVTAVRVNSPSESAAVVASPGVLLYLTASESTLASVRVDESVGFVGRPWLPISQPVAFSLSAQSGAKTIYVQVTDTAGRTSDVASVGVTLVQSPPVLAPIPTAYVGWDHYGANGVEATVLLTASHDLAAPAELSYALVDGSALDCEAATYTGTFAACASLPCTLPVQHLIPDPENPSEAAPYPIAACVRDAAGNVTEAAQLGSIVFDESWPSAVTGLVVIPESQQVQISWIAVTDPGPAGISHYEVDYAPSGVYTFTTVTSPDNGPLVISGLADLTEYQFRVRAIDRSGNAGSYSSYAYAVPGLRGGVVDQGLLSFGGNGYVSSHYLDGQLYVIAESRAAATRNDVFVWRCPIGTTDCRTSTAWTRTVLDGLYSAEGSPKLGATTRRLYVGSQEWDAATGTVFHVVWACNRNTDCSSRANWTRVSLASAVTTLRLGAGSIATTASHVATGYVNGNAPANTVLWTCRDATDCTSAANWRASTLTNVAFYSDPTVDLAAASGVLYAVWTNLPAKIGRCDTATDCDAAGDWTVYDVPGTGGGTARSHQPQLARTRDHLYLKATYRANAGPDYQSVISRCALSSSCDAAGDWSSSTSYWHYQENVRAPLAFDAGRLHTTWYSSKGLGVTYAWCDQPDSASCQVATNWKLMRMPLASTRYQAPSVAAFGKNMAVTYLTDEGDVVLGTPEVNAPVAVVSAPGYGVVHTRWSRRTDVAGYEHLYDADGGPAWDAQAVFPDPLLNRSSLSVSGGSTLHLAVQSYSASGAVSSTSSTTRARPLQAGGLWGTTYDYCNDGGTWCIDAAAGAVGTRAVIAYNDTNWSTAQIYTCDAASAPCGPYAAWSRIAMPSAGRPFGVAALGTRAIIGMTVSNNVLVASCDLATGCGSWQSRSGVLTGAAERYAQIAVGASTSGTQRVFVADVSDAGALRLTHCNLATDCSVAGNWVAPVTVAAEVSDRGLGLVVAGGVATIIRATPTAIKSYGCDIDATACDAAADFVTATLATITGAGPVKHTTRASLTADGKPIWISVWDSQPRIGVCGTAGSACSGNAFNWAVTSLPWSAVATYPSVGVATDITVQDGRTWIAFGNQDRMVLGSCAYDCERLERWEILDAAILPTGYSTHTMKTTANAHFLWVLPNRELGLAHGTAYTGFVPYSYSTSMGAGGLWSPGE